MHRRLRQALLGWFALGVAVVIGAAQAPPSSQSPPFTGGTTAITVDVVVRDKHGKPVTDLKRDDFALAEDGVRQDIGDMTLVAVPGAPGKAETSERNPGAKAVGANVAEPVAPASVTAPTFVALVFDRLSPEGRALAYKGALAYLGTDRTNDFAGVYLSDLSLVTIQTYTSDRLKVAKALKDVASRATARFDRDAIRTPGCGSCPDSHPSVPFVASAESPGRSEQPGAGMPGQPASVAAAIENRSAAMWERLMRDEQGYATTNALLSLIAGLAPLPGRKTVVFFGEAIAIPDAVLPHFQEVVAAANRANVSVYTVDAAGLRVHSEDQETGRAINGIGSLALTTGADGGSASNLSVLESLGDVLRKDPRTSLSLLADQTGGFLINNTNDLASGFRKIDLDRRFHYLLTYTPRNGDFNGEWRSITVKVPSRDVQIRARSGYLAVRTPGAIPLLAYEGRAAADLDRMPAPAQIPIRASAFVFPQVTGDARVAVLVSTTGRALTFEPTSTGYRTDFTLLARLRDASGEVVRKASQPYRLSGPASEREHAQAGDVLFYRQPTLPPGTYTLDVVADDALAKRGAVSHLPVTVPAATTGPRVSSLIIVGRTEKIAAGGNPDENVLAVGTVQIYPNLGEPLRKSDGAALSFYAVILPQGTPVTASLALGQAGRTVATLPLTLGPPDATGRIQQVGQIPLASIPPGGYELTLTVTGGLTPVVRTAAFSVVE